MHAVFAPLSTPAAAFGAPRDHRRRAIGLATILGVHLLAAWGLLQMRSVRHAVVAAAPVFVNILDSQATAPAPATVRRPPDPPLARPERPAPPTPTVPLAAVQAAAAPAALQRSLPDATSTTPSTVASVEAPAPPQPSAPAHPSPEPASPPGPRHLPPSAVQYLVPPPLDYPRASRRLRESGRAVVSVFIDEAGLPRTVRISQSTGFPLLDEAALAAVRKARFKPYMEDGQAVAGWALIPLSFDLDL